MRETIHARAAADAPGEEVERRSRNVLLAVVRSGEELVESETMKTEPDDEDETKECDCLSFLQLCGWAIIIFACLIGMGTVLLHKFPWRGCGQNRRAFHSNTGPDSQKTTMRDFNPDTEEAQAKARDNERAVFAAKMQQLSDSLCAYCEGTGDDPEEGAIHCPACNGTGRNYR